MRHSIALRRSFLLSAASVIGILAAGTASAQSAADSGLVLKPDESVIANHEVDPLGPGSLTTGAAYANSPDVLDPFGSVNGVGQMILINTGVVIAPEQGGGIGTFLGLCTGTLINPRTVITAAHCVYNDLVGIAANGASINIPRAPHEYGSNTGTANVPISFGFSSLNRGCMQANGLPTTSAAICGANKGPYEHWRDSAFQTVASKYIYNVNQVWYDQSANPLVGGEFANKDIALATLDTHAKDIPTWAMLFSPLDGPVHATLTGYGTAGVGLSGIGNLAGTDYRRRSAENMIDALMTTHDFNSSPAIAGPANTTFLTHQHAIYWMDFDDPDYQWSITNVPANSAFIAQPPTLPARSRYWDFNGLGGDTLPNEGSTAAGDSGGPLIVDQRWDRDVIVGVLTGSFSFNGGIGLYGQFNVYPPLFQFWEDIVQNNPYKYVSAKAGNGDWFDPTHWVQDMDPNYMVIGPDGKLLNQLPDNPQGGADGVVDKYGEVCFYQVSCKIFDGPSVPAGDGVPHSTADGPGSTGFVPDNVEPVNSATAGETVKARYYDVTLRETGTTTLSAAATIDKMTIDGFAKLSIGASGNLNVWAEYNQISGWTNVDGMLKTDESMIFSGLLTGKGTFNPTYLTVVGGVVAPGGGDTVGTLTVQGDVILASASALFLDVQRGSADQLAVTGDAQNDGLLALSGGSVVFNKVTDAPSPRHGESYVIATAAGGVLGTFGTTYTFQGVLRPELSYAADSITATLRAGSLVEVLDGGSETEIAFANALDQLRSGSYASLWNLYGSVDWMNGAQLSATFSALTPRVIGDVGTLHARQSKLLMANVTDRLSLIGSGRAQGLSLAGQPSAAFAAGSSGVQSGKLGFGASHGGGATIAKLPGKLTGFISGGIDRTRSSYGDHASVTTGQGGWHMAMGLESPIGESGRFGTAVGVAEGESRPGGDSHSSRTTMAAAYAALPLGEGFYAGGLVSAESARASIDRQSTDGIDAFRLTGATGATRYSAVVEAGYSTGIGRGLTLTPRAQLGYGRYTLDGFREEGGETALQIEDVTVSRVEARLGARLEGTTRLAGIAVIPQISADYVHLLSGRQTGAMVRFAAAPDQAFFLPLSESAAGWAEVKGGVTFGDGPLTLGLSGQHAVGAASMSDQRTQAELRFRF